MLLIQFQINDIDNNENIDQSEILTLSNFLYLILKSKFHRFYSKKHLNDCITFTQKFENLSFYIKVDDWKNFYIWFYKNFTIFFSIIQVFCIKYLHLFQNFNLLVREYFKNNKSTLFDCIYKFKNLVNLSNLVNLVNYEIKQTDSTFILSDLDNIYIDTCEVVHNLFDTIVHHHSKIVIF